MHDNDVDEQTRELSYPRELKILHFRESRRDAELHKANMRASVGKQFVCRQFQFVKWSSFLLNGTDTAFCHPAWNDCVCKLQKRWQTNTFPAQDYSKITTCEKVFESYTPSGG